jgi:hypothetical protein
MHGQATVKILRGGMLAWEAADLLEAIDYIDQDQVVEDSPIESSGS